MTLDLDKNLKKEIGVVRYSASNSSECVFKLESELKILFCFVLFLCCVWFCWCLWSLYCLCFLFCDVM